MTIPAGFKPMLAEALPAGQLPVFPCYVSPKLDGVRAVVFGGVVYSRNLKPIRNAHVQKVLGHALLEGYDGELIVGPPTSPTAFRDTTSGVMAVLGEPNVLFHVFDVYSPARGFNDRYHGDLGSASHRAARSRLHIPMQLVAQKLVHNAEELLAAEQDYLDQGYEGAMVRSVDGPYKCGRATVREGYLLKVKRFSDAEALVVGYEELMHNENEKTTDALGHAKRSTAKAGKVGGGALGTLLCKDPETGVEFGIGGGFTAEERLALWRDRDTLVGRIAKYKFFPTGSKEAPRFPVMLGFRDPSDA
jgi:DNA ligase-1